MLDVKSVVSISSCLYPLLNNEARNFRMYTLGSFWVLTAIDIDINYQLSPSPDAVIAVKLEIPVKRNGTMKLVFNTIVMGRRDRKARHLAARLQSRNGFCL